MKDLPGYLFWGAAWLCFLGLPALVLAAVGGFCLASLLWTAW